MRNVDFTRNLILRQITRIRILMSSFPEPDIEAIGKFHGPDGAKMVARVTDYFMKELGHTPPSIINGDSPTLKAARKFVPDKL